MVEPAAPPSAIDSTTAHLAKLKQGLDGWNDLDERIQALSKGVLGAVRGSQVSTGGSELMAIQHTIHSTAMD